LTWGASALTIVLVRHVAYDFSPMSGGPRELPSGTITFLFSDIEGSTRLVRELGKAWPEVLERHRRILRKAFGRHGGIEKGTEGDSFFVAFDDAPSAIAAAVDAQVGLANHRWPAGVGLAVRVGIHTGQGRVTHGDYTGLDVHRAARIGAAAHGGQVVVSATTRALAEHDLPAGVGLRDLGRHLLKDLPDEEQLFQLVIPTLPNDFPPLRAMGPTIGNVPVPVSSFIGRQGDVATLRDLLSSSRLVTLVGPAGSGKTRLVIEVARAAADAFPDGSWFVDLTPLGEASEVAPSIATATGVREVGAKPVDAVLADHFRPRRCLLVLDNFEHLLAATPLVAELLAAAPGLTVAATSQAELRLSGERLYPVAPLSVEVTDDETTLGDAIRLFIERASSLAPGFRVTPESTKVIGEICQRLDGLPLAIELAAARVRLLGVDEILRRLESRLELLAAGPSDAPERHRTLRAAIAWSYDLLRPTEATLFGRMAVFSGGATLAAIERVCMDGSSGQTPIATDPLDALDGLVRHSLARVDTAVAGTRFGMLETIREFALERLSEAGDEPAVRRRQAEWCAELLESLAPRVRLRPGEARVAEPELDNIRAALEWATETHDAELGLRICGSAWRVWDRGRRLREGLVWTQSFLALGDSESLAPHRIRALEAAGGIAYWLGDNGAAVAAYRERLALAERHAGAQEIADAHLDLVFGLANLGQTDAAAAELVAAISGYTVARDELGLARCRWLQTSTMVLTHRFTEALEPLKELLPIFRDHGDLSYSGLTLGSLAMVSMAIGDLAAAERSFREALAIGATSSTVAVITGLGTWSRLLDRLDQPRLAARLRGAYAALSATYEIHMSSRLEEVTDLILAQGQPGKALDPAEEARLMDEGRRLTYDDVVRIATEMSQDGVGAWQGADA
jgi:predicted ATPase/class 3 adenylate cyclase